MNFKIEAGWHVPLYETRFKKLRKKTGHIYEAMRHVKKFRLGLDIGANVGIMSSIMSEKFESVMAFECVPDTLECLNYNMKSFPNVKTFPFAISDKNGEIDVAIPMIEGKMISSGWASIHPDRQKSFNEKKILKLSSRTVDSFNLDKLDFLKIDVEQAEMMVIQGALNTIEKFKPVIVFENKRHENDHVRTFLENHFRYQLIPSAESSVDSIMV